MSMSMSVRQKKLTKKVLCSLLAAGMINVCISGGDVWAAESEPNIVNIASPSTDYNGGAEYRYAGVFVDGETKEYGKTNVVDKIVFNSANSTTNSSSSTLGAAYNAAVVTAGGTLELNAKEIYVGSEAQGGDRGFRLTGDNNTLNITADKIVSYTGDEFVHVRKGAANVANITVGDFYAKTTWGKDDYGVSILQVNEGGTINFNADKAVFDGSTNVVGGVFGSGSWGTLNITANELSIDGNICGTYGTLTGIQHADAFDLHITAGNLVMAGDINAGSMGDGYSKHDRTTNIAVNVTDTAELTGDINVYERGNIAISSDTMNWEGSATVNKGTLDISKVNNLTLTGVTANADEAVLKVTNGGTLAVNENGKLGINDLKTAGTYKIVSVDESSTANFWKDENLAYDRTSMFAEVKQNNRDYDVVYKELQDLSADEKEAAKEQIVAAAGGTSLAATSVIGSIVTDSGAVAKSAPGAKAFVAAVTGSADITSAQAAAHINAAVQMGETSGTSANAVSVASNVTGTVTGRMSLNAAPIAEVGGKGRSLYEDKSGAGIWAQYVHGKDKVRDMAMAGGSASYDSKYNGFVLGTDFAKIGKFQSGIAFTYGSGDTTSVGGAAYSRNDFDFWGVSLYGSMRNSDTNLIADIGYSRSDSDVEQNNFGSLLTANPKTDTITLGIKGEKLYQYDNLQVMPYVGLRYLSVDTGSYSSDIGGLAAFNYAPERQNIWLLPVGVSLTYENITDNGWKIRPNVDLSYMWAMGDTDSSMTVGLPGTTAADRLGYTIMDKGSFIGKVGLEAEKGHMTYGVSYSYQKGSDAKSNKWFVDLKYSF